MFRETTYVEDSGDLAVLGAAMFLAIISYPDSIPKRDDFVNACRAWVIKGVTGGQLKTRLVNNHDILKFSDTRKIYRQFDKAGKIIVDKRLPAITLFKLQLANITPNTIVTLSNGKKFSINKWVEIHYATSPEKGEKYNEKNFYRRVWSPSKPIIHLIAGFENSITEEHKPLSIEKLLVNPSWVPNAISISENLRKVIPLLEGINICESKQIQVLPKNIT